MLAFWLPMPEWAASSLPWRCGKPIVLVPRFAAKGEHTTDHQVHTVRWLRQKPGVYVAMSDDDLADAINRALVEKEPRGR